MAEEGPRSATLENRPSSLREADTDNELEDVASVNESAVAPNVDEIEHFINESHQDSLEETPEVENSQRALELQTSRRSTVITITVGAIGAIVMMLGHHFFLSWLDGRRIGDSSQSWMKNASNALAQLAGVFIGMVAGSVLSELVWRTVSKHLTRISIIDALFSLPAPTSILSLAGKDRARWMLLPAFMAIFIQTLILVSIFAPNALTIEPGVWNTINTTIPSLDFASITNAGNANLETGPSLSLIIETAGNTWDIWDASPDCQSECSFSVEYEAPSISCRSLREDEMTVGAYNGSNATWVIYDSELIPSNASVGTLAPLWGQPYPALWLNYLPTVSYLSNDSHLAVNQTGPAAGLRCDYLDGKFQANFSITGGHKNIQIAQLSQTNGSIDGCSWDQSWNHTTRCGNYSTNARSIVHDFSSIWTGTIDWEFYDGSFLTPLPNNEQDIRSYGALLPQLININFRDTNPDEVATDPNATNVTISLSGGSGNASQIFEELFATTILAAMVSNNQTTRATVSTSDGRDVWAYSPVTLWATYGPAAAVLLLLALLGLYYARINKLPLSNEFSTLFITSRNKDLDRIFRRPGVTATKEFLRLDKPRRRFILQEQHNDAAIELMTRSDREDIEHDSQSARAIVLPSDRRATITMIAVALLAVILVLVHFVFLIKLRGRRVETFSDFWARNIGNALAQAVSLCLGVVFAHSLTQLVWRVVRMRPTPIAGIDHLFALPNPNALLMAFTGRWTFSFISTVIITWSTYALFLVGVFAPNVLTIGESDKIAQQFSIPYLNYSRALYQHVRILEAEAPYVPPEQMWISPCSTGNCAFEFDYEAPAISCVDIPNPGTGLYEGEFPLTGNGQSPPGQSFLRANYSLDIWSNWGPSYARQLQIQYIPMDATITNNSQPVIHRTGDPSAVVCRFMDGTYHARFQMQDGTKTINTTLLHYNNTFTERCSQVYHSAQFLPDCDYYPTISDGFIDLFDSSLAVTVGFFQNGTQWYYREIPDVYITYRDGSIIPPGIEKLFKYDRSNVTESGSDATISLSLQVPSLAQAITDLFSNLTLNVMREAADTVLVQGVTWGDTVWRVDVGVFWIVYGSALGLSFIIGAFGLWCIHDNGISLNSNVSTILLATRTEDLDTAYEGVRSRGALARLRLCHEKGSCFVVDGLQGKHGGGEGEGTSTSVLLPKL